MILGLTGSFGAGKGTVVEYLEEKGFTHYSTSGVIREEIIARGMPVNRDSYIVVGNDLRKQFGAAHLVDVCYEKAQKEGGNAIIESLRAVAEVNRIHELGGKVIGVDADPHIRYERVVLRGSEKDFVTFEQWMAQQEAESNPDDPTKQDIFSALKLSDAIVTNDGTLEELHHQVDDVLKKFT